MVRSHVASRISRAIYTPNLAVRSQILTRRARPHLLYQPVSFIRAASHSSEQPTIHKASHPSKPVKIEKSAADEKIEEITELFYTAQDEFEIAMEETEKVSVYAEEDRKAAREEFDKVQEVYRTVVEGEDAAMAEEVKRRIGQRIRELEQGVKAMEELAMNQD